MKFIFFLLGALWSVSLGAQEPSTLRHLGYEEAPVHMYLFSSYMCPHCAHFHQKILPEIQKKYLDNKQAYLTFVEVANDKDSLIPVLLTQCMDLQRALSFAEQLYHQQSKWAYEKDSEQKLFQIAKNFGMTQSDVDKCLKNRSLIKKVIDQQNNLSQIYDIQRLPTLIVRRGNQVTKLEGADEKHVLGGIQEFYE